MKPLEQMSVDELREQVAAMTKERDELRAASCRFVSPGQLVAEHLSRKLDSRPAKLAERDAALAGMIEIMEVARNVLKDSSYLTLAQIIREKIDSLPASAKADAKILSDAKHTAHLCNEWADAATNGLQWLKNVRDGASTIDEAIASMISNIEYCRAVRAKEEG